MNLQIIKWFICVFFAFSCDLNAFCQSSDTLYPKSQLINGDTIFSFTINQARKLAQNTEELKFQKEINSLNEKQLDLKDSIIGAYVEQTHAYDQIIKSDSVQIDLHKQKTELYANENNDLRRELRKKKRRNIITLVSGGVAYVATLYICISKK